LGQEPRAGAAGHRPARHPRGKDEGQPQRRGGAPAPSGALRPSLALRRGHEVTRGRCLLLVLFALLASVTFGCGKHDPAGGAASASLPPGAVPANADPPPPVPLSSAAPAIVNGEGMPMSFGPLARRADPSVATVKARVEREGPAGRKRLVAEGLGTAFVYD